jgi:hypothetical protein
MFNKNLNHQILCGFMKNKITYNDKFSLYKFNFKKNFDQYKDRPKRHFMLLYRFTDDMHYKRVPYKEDHQKLIEQFEQNGTVVLGG